MARRKVMAMIGARCLLVGLALLLSSVACAGRVEIVPAAAPVTVASAASAVPSPPPPVLSVAGGCEDAGEWSSEATVSLARWQSGASLAIDGSLHVSDTRLSGLTDGGVKVDGFVVLVTAERTFDPHGRLRLPNDEKMSTLLTPAGLAIEGGADGAVTNRFGYGFRTPVDELVTVPSSAGERSADGIGVKFKVQTKLPDDLPPGIYRLRFDYGATAGKRYVNLNGQAFARREFLKDRCRSFVYSRPIRADGNDVGGRAVDASAIQPRIPWTILGTYNSNGYRGVVADEDKPYFALSDRNIIHDDVILPLYNDGGSKIAYSLEPQFVADTIDESANIPWDYARGELAIQVTGPDGKTIDLGAAPFTKKAGAWATTGRPAFTSWKPAGYGRYTVNATGFIADTWGNRYEGGGTYHFWIAKRMTLATPTFQGQAYPVGTRYGRDISFAPAVPADVEVTATLYVSSDPGQTKTITYRGKASPSGIFGQAQGSQPFALDAPGEYHAQILATYTDHDGHLWVASMRHAGVVYTEDSPIVARGKKLSVGDKLLDRGETHFEGWVDKVYGKNHLAHINFPFQAGDVLLIASEEQSANKIIPVLTYEPKNGAPSYDPKLQAIGITNLRLATSNGYSPHLYPEFITDWAYYYAGAPRPGFMSRFIVAESGARAPYWHVSPNGFGGQINASNNGDLPGDIYRLLGGVVLRRQGQAPSYAGYMASAFILPKGTGNNRIVAPGSEDLLGPTGEKARFWLVGTRPGIVYETGAVFVPSIQIDPILAAIVTYTLTYPNGKKVVARGVGNAAGLFVGAEKWTLDVPGVYRYTLDADYQGHKGVMPGLPAAGGELYVIEKERPAGTSGLRIDLPAQSSFSPADKLTIRGTSSADSVHYAAVIPGAAVLQGDAPVKKGKFELVWDPAVVSKRVPTYDITNLATGKPEIKDVVHITFFSKEKPSAGPAYHAFARVILRGTSVIYTR